MKKYKDHWIGYIKKALEAYGKEKGLTGENGVLVETPPTQDLGDFAFPMFPYAKIFKENPKEIAQKISQYINRYYHQEGKAQSAGPYVNITLEREAIVDEVIGTIFSKGTSYGNSDLLADRRVAVEFSCPNTNKPLHLGHLRNDALGESISRILKANGAEVRKVNLINDRGIHICKSMLAYKKFGMGRTPETEGRKSDHFVGNYYVAYANWEKEDPSAEQDVREMLKKWESGDPEVMDLWKTMNEWTIRGIEETYKKTGVTFDTIYYESQTYGRGKEEVLKGLEKGTFYKNESGAICIDLKDINLDTKVLLRGDGTSLYLTQDIGTAIARYEDWPFDEHIYVVASEQKYHFTVLFHVLKKLGFTWADQLYHLAYGMVNLPEGKMKSREGTVVDADELLLSLAEMAKTEIKEKEREEEVDDVEKTSECIALGALHYFLLQVSPYKDTLFDPQESISFNGNTGPYLQYVGARIHNLLTKYKERKRSFEDGTFSPAHLSSDEEWAIIKHLSLYSQVVKEAAEEKNPAVVTSYLYDLGRDFSRWYHDHPILHNEDSNVVVSRIDLARAVLMVLQHAFHLLAIPYLENM
jgi:arginyl-tRNA synthetase